MPFNRKWSTTSEAAIRELVLKGRSWDEISKELNVGLISLKTTAGVLGIKSLSRRTDVDSTRTWWVPALASGATISDIARAEGRTEYHIRNALNRRGFPATRSAAIEFMSKPANLSGNFPVHGRLENSAA